MENISAEELIKLGHELKESIEESMMKFVRATEIVPQVSISIITTKTGCGRYYTYDVQVLLPVQ